MDRVPVSSSNLKSVGYDEISQILEIEFHSEGRIYQYSSVPKYRHEGLMNASSKGSYFHAYIRDKYPTTRIR